MLSLWYLAPWTAIVYERCFTNQTDLTWLNTSVSTRLLVITVSATGCERSSHVPLSIFVLFLLKWWCVWILLFIYFNVSMDIPETCTSWQRLALNNKFSSVLKVILGNVGNHQVKYNEEVLHLWSQTEDIWESTRVDLSFKVTKNHSLKFPTCLASKSSV